MAIYKPPFSLLCDKCKKVTEWHHDDFNPGSYGSYCSECKDREKSDKLTQYYKKCNEHKDEWDKLSIEEKLERIYLQTMKPTLPVEEVNIQFNKCDCHRRY